MTAGAEDTGPARLSRRGALSLVTLAISAAIIAVQLLVRSAISRDEMENIQWGQALSWGNEKHPPLFGWIHYAWVELFGRADLTTFLLEKANLALGLYLAYHLARRILGPNKALLATALSLATVNVFLLALKFNGNSVLWSSWAAFLLALHVAVRGGRIWAWLLTGLLGAATVLAKYHSLVLLGCSFLFLLSTPGTRSLFRRPGIWLGVAAGLAVLAPHILWLLGDGQSAVAYARDNLTAGSGLSARVRYPLKFLLIQAVFLCPALVLIWRWGRRDWLETRAPPDEIDRAFLLWHGLLLGLAPAVLSLLAGLSLGSMWGLGTWSLFPAWALARFGIRPQRRRVGRALQAALVLLAVYVVAAVTDGLFVARQLAYKPAATAVREAWYARYSEPLSIVGGAGRYYEALAVYAPEEPDVFGALDPRTHRRVTAERLREEGAVLVIAAELEEAVELARERFPVTDEARIRLPADARRLYRTREDELVVLFVAPDSRAP